MTPEELVDQATKGHTKSLGKLLTKIERADAEESELSRLLYKRSRGAQIVGITGPPGSGKSTLVGKLVELLANAAAPEAAALAGESDESGHDERAGNSSSRGEAAAEPNVGGAGDDRRPQRSEDDDIYRRQDPHLADKPRAKPAVVAVDPSSPLTGGAILGDRVRMQEIEGVFIRSVATRGHAGGLALSIPGAVTALDAAGYDPVIIETVGIGQVEVDVSSAADTTVVVVNPQMGDAVQANKAGLLEVADIFVVNKADLPGAYDTKRDLERMLDLSHVSGHDREHRPPIIMVSALDGSGVADVAAAIASHRTQLVESNQLPAVRAKRFAAEVEHRLKAKFGAEIDALLNTDDLRHRIDDALTENRPPIDVANELWTQTGR